MAFRLPFDPTPGFSLGISDKINRFVNAGNSFKGSGGNKVVFTNPTGKSRSSSKSSRTERGVKGLTTSSEPQYQGSGGSGGSGGGSNTADIGLIDAGIQNANTGLGQLDEQQRIGQENINNSFNSALNRLLSSRATAKRDYKTTKTQSTQDNINARHDITAGVGRLANATQRLLGARGAGNSSAAQIVAPYGAAREGTRQLRGVTDAFGRNMQELDTNFADFNRDWGLSREELDDQKFQSEQSLRSDVASSRKDLLTTLAELSARRAALLGGGSQAVLAAAQPHLDQARTLAGTITNLGRQYAKPISVSSPTYAAPDLEQYSYDGAAAPEVDNTSAYTDSINPAFTTLFGLDKRRQQPQFSY